MSHSSNRLRELERQLQVIRNDEKLTAEETALQFAALEKALSEILQDPESDLQDFQTVSFEELQDWHDVCEHIALESATGEAERLSSEYFENMARSWHEVVDSTLEDCSADDCFEALMTTTEMQLESRGEFPGQHVGKATFESARSLLREGLLEEVQAEPPAKSVIQQWERTLADRSDTVLTSIDHLSPKRAAAQLELLQEDLLWHDTTLSNITPRQSRVVGKKYRRIRAEQQERTLQHKLENRFGTRLIGFVERLILFLIFLVILLMFIEMIIPLPQEILNWFAIVDTACCVIFLMEFFTKLSFVEEKGFWFRRHFLIDLIPSIPVGLVTYGVPTASTADVVRTGRLGRLLRLPRLARYIRIARPVIRILRGFGLLSRGLDRLARQYGHILNLDVILYPTREELDRTHARSSVEKNQVSRLRENLQENWIQLLGRAPVAEREMVAHIRLAHYRTLMEQLPADKYGLRLSSSLGMKLREIPAEDLINRLKSASATGVETELGEELVEQLARMIRMFSRPPLRWLPLVRSSIPRITNEMSDAEIVAAGSHQLSRSVARFHNAWFWVSDLYGTVTPSQFVDRVGGMLVRSTMRPAYRVLLIGGVLLLTNLLLSFTSSSFLAPLTSLLDNYVTPTVWVLGSVCFLFLGLGWWLQRVAREATEFYERSVHAQYLALTEVIRARHLERDMEILYHRVLSHDWVLLSKSQGSEIPRDELKRKQLEQLKLRAMQTFTGSGESDQFDGVENTLLLYHDWLDGAMFTEVDTRTTSQLLGNPAIRQFISLSNRITRRFEKSIQTLDLVRQKSLIGGPYIWFNFITRSVAHSVAHYIVEYNQKAIPLDELPLSTEEQKSRYREWLHGTNSGFLKEDHAPSNEDSAVEVRYLTTAFTALHFLDLDAGRDQNIANRFGPAVLEKLQHDRSLLVRRIFGTFPKHHRPKEERVVNLYSFYSQWLSGGRALFIPLFLLVAFFKLFGRLIAGIWHALQEIRKPELRQKRQDAATAHFLTAVRKIERFRGPVVKACLRLRTLVDPEYLSVPLPGDERSSIEGADVESDLQFLGEDPELREEVEQERLQVENDIRRFEVLIQEGLLERLALIRGLSKEAFLSELHVRAASICYVANFKNLRNLISHQEILQELFQFAETKPLMPKPGGIHWLLRWKFLRYWKQTGEKNRRKKKVAWHATLNDLGGVRTALETWFQSEESDQDKKQGEQFLSELLLHPSRITDQLLTLRTVQTLSLLDVLNYREYVYRLGKYSEGGETPGHLLEWNTLPNSS